MQPGNDRTGGQIMLKKKLAIIGAILLLSTASTMAQIAARRAGSPVFVAATDQKGDKR
jgi:Spy/CpxP family protein refolding chaperone